MQRFLQIFNKNQFNVIGMIHLNALPGTPKYAGNWPEIVEKACHEAHIYTKQKLHAVLIENMHDVPYLPDKLIGAETVACMSSIATAVRQCLPIHIPCGIQVLAAGNQKALAIAKACNLQFIRAEGFVFAHVADEGYTDACAGALLRYRRHIDAEHVLVFTDLKKKHSSHAITQDVSLLETAKAAEFFLTDGIVLTGNATGDPAKPEDLAELTAGKVMAPLLIGSGVTLENVQHYMQQGAHGAIIGSHFKHAGHWENQLCEESISKFMQHVQQLKEKQLQVNR